MAGAVSTTHNIFAVLEDCGRISILALDAHEQGGIHSPQADADILSVSLSKQDRPSMSCLVFDPSGSRLFAVDPKGKIVVAEFEKA